MEFILSLSVMSAVTGRLPGQSSRLADFGGEYISVLPCYNGESVTDARDEWGYMRAAALPRSHKPWRVTSGECTAPSVASFAVECP